MQDTVADHESRLRVLEQIAADTRESLRSLENTTNSRLNEVNARITNLMVVTIILWATTILSIMGLVLGSVFGPR